MMIDQMMPVPPLPSYGCMVEVATSAFQSGAAAPSKLPPRSPLLKGEEISCTCDSGGSSQHSAAAAAGDDHAPEVTQSPPLWLEGLFTADLFNPCPCHANVRKNECNFYCLTCTAGRGRGMCKYCLADHKGCSGRVFQIRKYMYQTCVHVDDLQGLCDTSGVQAYCINGKRAVLIHPKVMTPGQQCPVFDNTCRGCDKPLRNDCQYCSLKCKVDVQYGRAPRTPEAGGLDVAQHQPRAPMTKPSPPASAAPSTSLSEEEGSARSSYSRWTSASRGKKRKCDKPLRSYVC